MGTFYPVKVEINPANLPGSIGSTPIWNGSIFELKPIKGNALIYSQEPSVMMDTNYGLSTSYTVLENQNMSLDNSALNNCRPENNYTANDDSFYLVQSGWYKFTYDLNISEGYYGLLELRVNYDDGTTVTVMMEDELNITSSTAHTENIHGEIYWESGSGWIYLDLRIDSIPAEVKSFELTCTNVNHDFYP